MARHHARLLPVCTILYDEREGAVEGRRYTGFQYKKVKHMDQLAIVLVKM